MPFTLHLPSLSPTMEEGTIAKWHKKVGDSVKRGDVLMEVQTDKATVEFEANKEGFLRKILVKEGTLVKVNEPVAIFSTDPKEEIKDYTPELIRSTEPGKVSSNQGTVETKTKAASTNYEGAMPTPRFEPEPPLQKINFGYATGAPTSRVVASPLAKKLGKEKGLDLTSLKGSGPNDRIVAGDLERAQKVGAVSFGKRVAPNELPGAYTETPLSPMRKIIAARLQQSKTFIPHFYVRQEVNAEPLLLAREQLKASDIKVTINDFVVRAAAIALMEHPTVNSGFNSVTQSIIRFAHADISIAVSIEDGLITPILRYADCKNLGEISVEVKALATKAKEGKLQPEEYKGGSFTISNLGMFGVSDFAAIINPPQSAILAVSAIEECVRFKNEVASAGKKMNITLSVDHRVIDGSEAAKFIKTLQKYLENPALLLV